MPDAPRAIALSGDYDGCYHWRLARPFEALAARGYPAALASKDDDRVSRVVHLYDVVILPRLSWHDRFAGIRFINALHRAGLTVIFEVDDDLFSPSINARLKQTTQLDASDEQLEQRRLDRLAALRLCDGVTVSSQRLATIMRTLVDAPVEVVPNAIDVQWHRRVVKGYRRQIKALTIGWAGGARPGHDFDAVAVAWERIARRYPHVQFVVQGHIPDVLVGAVPRDRLHTLPWLPLSIYPQGLREIDIACCSVANTAFNRAKTAIKLWESTLAGSACVVTPTLYGPYVNHGVNGLIAETADEWEEQLSRLVEDAELRGKVRRAQTRTSERRHRLEVNLWRWPNAWSKILAHARSRPRLAVA